MTVPLGSHANLMLSPAPPGIYPTGLSDYHGGDGEQIIAPNSFPSNTSVNDPSDDNFSRIQQSDYPTRMMSHNMMDEKQMQFSSGYSQVDNFALTTTPSIDTNYLPNSSSFPIPAYQMPSKALAQPLQSFSKNQLTSPVMASAQVGISFPTDFYHHKCKPCPQFPSSVDENIDVGSYEEKRQLESPVFPVSKAFNFPEDFTTTTKKRNGSRPSSKSGTQYSSVANSPRRSSEDGSHLSTSSSKVTSLIPCKFFRSGTCTAGNNCQFSHQIDVDHGPPLCKYFLKGNCKFGVKCALSHDLNGRSPTLPNSSFGKSRDETPIPNYAEKNVPFDSAFPPLAGSNHDSTLLRSQSLTTSPKMAKLSATSPSIGFGGNRGIDFDTRIVERATLIRGSPLFSTSIAGIGSSSLNGPFSGDQKSMRLHPPVGSTSHGSLTKFPKKLSNVSFSGSISSFTKNSSFPDIFAFSPVQNAEVTPSVSSYAPHPSSTHDQRQYIDEVARKAEITLLEKLCSDDDNSMRMNGGFVRSTEKTSSLKDTLSCETNTETTKDAIDDLGILPSSLNELMTPFEQMELRRPLSSDLLSHGQNESLAGGNNETSECDNSVHSVEHIGTSSRGISGENTPDSPHSTAISIPPAMKLTKSILQGHSNIRMDESVLSNAFNDPVSSPQNFDPIRSPPLQSNRRLSRNQSMSHFQSPAAEAEVDCDPFNPFDMSAGIEEDPFYLNGSAEYGPNDDLEIPNGENPNKGYYDPMYGDLDSMEASLNVPQEEFQCFIAEGNRAQLKDATVGKCRYGEHCRYLHGIECPYCGKLCLHPYNAAQQEEHLEMCSQMSSIIPSLNGPPQEELTCRLCNEKVLKLKDARFGLLNCEHIFCLGCIRVWRSKSMADMQGGRSCPHCRIQTRIITPSTEWFADPKQKQFVINEYKRKLKTIPCKYFNYGESTCPFGTSCFYAHTYKDGTKEDTKQRTCMNSDQEVRVLNAVKLSDFLEKCDPRRHSSLSGSNR